MRDGAGDPAWRWPISGEFWMRCGRVRMRSGTGGPHSAPRTETWPGQTPRVGSGGPPLPALGVRPGQVSVQGSQLGTRIRYSNFRAVGPSYLQNCFFHPILNHKVLQATLLRGFVQMTVHLGKLFFFKG